MRNILLIQLETKVALTIIAIVMAIFLIIIFRNIDNFNKVIENIEKQRTTYEKIRLQKNP